MSWFKKVALCVTLVGIGAALGCVAEDRPFPAGTGGGGSGGSSSACKLGSSLVGDCLLQ